MESWAQTPLSQVIAHFLTSTHSQHQNSNKLTAQEQKQQTFLLFQIIIIKKNWRGKMHKIPVNALDHDEDFLPRSVSPGLPVNNRFSQEFL